MPIWWHVGPLSPPPSLRSIVLQRQLQSTSEFEYIGCFADQSDRALEWGFDSENEMTREVCLSVVLSIFQRSKRERFAGMPSCLSV